MQVKNKSNEIKTIRIYDAPVAVVWDAWIDPKKCGQWWGPRGFTLTTESKDVRVGGSWVYTMHGPDGVDWPNVTKYVEVEPLKKLVYDHGGTATQPPMFRVTALFKEVDGKTHMDMTMELPTPEKAEETRKFIKKAGGDATWDRLAEFLAKETSGKEIFVINRSFACPIELMFDLWTVPKHLGTWMAPKGFQTEFHPADIRPGGSNFYSQSSGEAKMYGRAEYVRIEKPTLIQYKQQFADENENVVRHPMAPTWPETMLTTVRFTEEGPEQTRITVTCECVDGVSKDELDTFVNARAGMTGGFTGTFDKLEEYIEEVRK